MPSFHKPFFKMGSAKAQPEEDPPSPLDVIFACSVCGDTFSDVYEGHGESVQGFSDGINPKDRRVTRLYVSACCHVICIKHIGGGNGPPFHPAGQHPRAPCPVCAKDGGEERPRELYSIRGFNEGEYDPAIPKFWFSAPPMRLEGNGREMEALRFQYLALIRYSRKTSAAYKRTKANLGESQQKLQNMEELASAEHAKVLSLEQELERLRPLEQELLRFKARLPAIEHYLRLLPRLVEERELMQNRLASVGFRMALEPIPNHGEPLPLDEEGKFDNEYVNRLGAEQQKTASSHTAGRSAHNTGYAQELGEAYSPQTHRPYKRPRVDSSPRSKNIHAAPSSRDLMPPPPKSISRMKSVRNIIPTIRKKFSSGKASAVPQPTQTVNSDAQMYENGYWEAIDPSTQPSSDRDRPPTRHSAQQDKYYMSGALPVEHPQQATCTRDPQRPPNVGLNDDRAEFTFRSPSPIKLDDHQSDKLSTEPSYIRLMDGLGDDNGLNLGLQDPRGHAPDRTHRDTYVAQRGEHERSGGKVRNHRSSGHALPTQSPIGVSRSHAYRHPDSLRSHPTNTSTSNTPNRSAVNPVTPAPPRFQRPTQEVDDVVSPFFGSSKRNPPHYTRAPPAERHDSMIRSNGYPFHRQPEREAETDWRGGRSLNGLSFFNSPLNERNEPIEWRHEPRRSECISSSQQYQPRNVNSRGFITRPESGRLPYVNGSSYASLDRSSSTRQQHVHSQSAIAFPSFSRTSQSRAAPLPTAMSSFVPGRGRSPLRNSSQLDGLERAGVRSSRLPRTKHPGNAFATSARPLFSRSGRRSVRR